jgi:hypothetical protein
MFLPLCDVKKSQSVRTITVRWRPLKADGTLVNQLQQDVPLGHLVVPDATLDSEL